MMDAQTLHEAAQAASDMFAGVGIADAFRDGPRRLVLEHDVPRHGTYRLYIARPFGVRKQAGLRWRVQITVQFDGQNVQHGVNDGHITVPFEDMGEVIIGAADQMAEHINANARALHQARRAAMQAVQAPGAVEVS